MNYKLEDLIDVQLLQELQEKLNEVYSFPSAIIDNEGKILTAVAWQDICTKFHRVNPESERECIKSDKYILEHLSPTSTAVSYTCPHGLTDNATPIIIDGMHLGNFFTGQFFIEKPDMDFFTRQAEQFGFNQKEYLEAVEKVPIWSREKLGKYLDFIQGFIQIIAGIGLKNLKEIEVRGELNKTNKELNEARITALKLMDEAVAANEALKFTNSKLVKGIEELNKAQEELKLSHERYNALIEFTHDGYWVTDVERNILDVNEPYCKMSGYSKEELLKMKINDLEFIESIEETKKHINELIENGWSRFQSKHKRKNGEIIEVEVSATYLKSQNTVLAFFKDIRDKIKAENALVESESKYKMLAKNSSDVIWTMDLNRKFTYISPSVEKLRGYTAQEIMQQKFEEIVSPSSLKMVLEKIEEKIAAAYNNFKIEPELVEVEQPCKDGSTVWTEVVTDLLYDEYGKPIGIIGVSRNINERKKINDALVESEDRYKKAQQVGHVGSWEYDIVNNSFWGSDEGKRIYGFDANKENFNADDVMKCVIEADRVNKAMVDLIEKNIPYNIEFEIYPLNSKNKRTIHSIAELVRDENGNPIKVTGVMLDITERKNSERAVFESEKRYRNFVTNSSEGIYRIDIIPPVDIKLPHNELIKQLDKQAIVAEVNEAMASMYGLTTEEMEGMLAVKYAPDHSLRVLNLLSPLNYKVTNIKTIDYDKNGNKIYLSENCFAEVIDDKLISIWGSQTNVTERKKIEEALKLTQFTIDHAADSVYWITADAHIIDVNEASCKMLGYTKEELVQLYVKDVDIIYTDEFWEEHFNELRTLGSIKVESKQRKKNGDVIAVEIVANYVRFENRELNCAFVRDITERKKVEAELRESELKYRTLIENTSDVAFCLNSKGEYQFTNNVFASIFGKNPEYFIGKSIWDIYPKEEADYRFKATEEVFLTGESRSLEVSVPLGDKTMHFIAKANPIKDEKGKVILAFTTAIDITERKNAEERLRESEEKYRKLADDLPVMISSFLPDGTLTYVNEPSAAIVNLKVDELLGKSFFEMIPPSEFLIVKKQLESLTPQNPSETHEQSHISPDGAIQFYRWTNRAFFDKAGNKKGFQAVGIDITELKKAEEDLKEKMGELERFNKVMIGREEKMIALKNEINELLVSAGKEKKYNVIYRANEQ